MLQSVYGSEHCIELIQMTVLGGTATDQLFRSNAALLSGPSWAAPHVVVVKKKKRSRRTVCEDETTSCWPQQTHGDAALECRVGLTVPSGVQPAQRSAL